MDSFVIILFLVGFFFFYFFTTIRVRLLLAFSFLVLLLSLHLFSLIVVCSSVSRNSGHCAWTKDRSCTYSIYIEIVFRFYMVLALFLLLICHAIIFFVVDRVFFVRSSLCLCLSNGLHAAIVEI